MSGGPFLRTATSLAIILGGCASTPPPADSLPPVAPPTHASVPNSAPVALPANIGRSIEGRPIEMYRFGPATPPVLIIAAIHGNERSSAACAELLSDAEGFVADVKVDGAELTITLTKA